MILPKRLKLALAGSVQRVLDAAYVVYRDQYAAINNTARLLSAEEFGSLVAEKLRKGEK